MLRQPRLTDEPHLRFVRERSCLICGAVPCDAAHIKMADARVLKPIASNIGMKADDMYTVPLCREHHGEQHDMPERAFWDLYRIDPVLTALWLYAVSLDGRVRGRRLEASERADRMIDNTRLASMALRS